MIDGDDLALLASSFEAAMLQAPGAAAVDAMLHELGWADLLAVAALQGAAAAFTKLGTTGSAACLLDDVLASALGVEAGPTVCVVLPPPHRWEPAGQRLSLGNDSGIRVDGLVSARIDIATLVVVPVYDSGRATFVEVDAAQLRDSGSVSVASSSASAAASSALDPMGPFRRVQVDVADNGSALAVSGTWEEAVRDARAALAQQLIGASRAMLIHAREHALGRVQFGRPIASFQAVRHRLADVLVAIESAAAVADACIADERDPLLAALAKSLAGKAARITASNVQQVLAGIGFTTDHPFHLSLKRTMVIDTLFGSARSLPPEIGRQLLAQGGAPRLVNL